MARYRKIDPKIWNDEKFRAFSNNGKLVFLFVLTHPHMTSLGAMRGTVAGLTAELGWKPKAFAEAFAEALSGGVVEHDEKAAFICVPNFLKYNPPESPNVVKSWAIHWDNIPECELKGVLYERVKAFLEGFAEGFRGAFGKALRKPLPYPEHEHEHEHEYEHKKKEPPPAAPYSEAFDMWWFVYPKRGRTEKPEAFDEWKAATKRIVAERQITRDDAVGVLLEAGRAFAQSDKGQGKYCPHAKRWLKKNRWDDDRESWKERTNDGTRPRRKPDGRASF